VNFKIIIGRREWWCLPVIPALGRQRLEELKAPELYPILKNPLLLCVCVSLSVSLSHTHTHARKIITWSSDENALLCITIFND
jgi:hypothetical protein